LSIVSLFATAKKVEVSPGRPLHLKPEFDCQGTSFGILSRSHFRGKVVGALAGISWWIWGI